MTSWVIINHPKISSGNVSASWSLDSYYQWPAIYNKKPGSKGFFPCRGKIVDDTFIVPHFPYESHQESGYELHCLLIKKSAIENSKNFITIKLGRTRSHFKKDTIVKLGALSKTLLKNYDFFKRIPQLPEAFESKNRKELIIENNKPDPGSTANVFINPWIIQYPLTEDVNKIVDEAISNNRVLFVIPEINNLTAELYDLLRDIDNQLHNSQNQTLLQTLFFSTSDKLPDWCPSWLPFQVLRHDLDRGHWVQIDGFGSGEICISSTWSPHPENENGLIQYWHELAGIQYNLEIISDDKIVQGNENYSFHDIEDRTLHSWPVFSEETNGKILSQALHDRLGKIFDRVSREQANKQHPMGFSQYNKMIHGLAEQLLAQPGLNIKVTLGNLPDTPLYHEYGAPQTATGHRYCLLGKQGEWGWRNMLLSLARTFDDKNELILLQRIDVGDWLWDWYQEVLFAPSHRKLLWNKGKGAVLDECALGDINLGQQAKSNYQQKIY